MKTKKTAFTLVELVVVIIILSILWTIAFIALQWYSTQARDSSRITDLSSMKSSLELFQLDSGKYPLVTDWVNIVFSWATVWTQWTFWENVYKNVDKLSKLPVDPISEREYTYSTTSNRYEYQLWGILESSNVTMNDILDYWLYKANAWDTFASAYVVWNYNWLISKINTWSTCNVLSVPSIITNDTSVTSLEQIVFNNSFVYTWFRNLPSSYKTSKFRYDWWFDFQPNKINLYTDTWSCENLRLSQDLRIKLLEDIKNAYRWTTLENYWVYRNITSSVIDLVTPSNDVKSLSSKIVENNLWFNKLQAWAACWYADWKNYSSTPTDLCNWSTPVNLVDNWLWNSYSWSCLWDWWYTVNCSANHIVVCSASWTQVFNYTWTGQSFTVPYWCKLTAKLWWAWWAWWWWSNWIWWGWWYVFLDNYDLWTQNDITLIVWAWWWLRSGSYWWWGGGWRAEILQWTTRVAVAWWWGWWSWWWNSWASNWCKWWAWGWLSWVNWTNCSNWHWWTAWWWKWWTQSLAWAWWIDTSYWDVWKPWVWPQWWHYSYSYLYWWWTQWMGWSYWNWWRWGWWWGYFWWWWGPTWQWYGWGWPGWGGSSYIISTWSWTITWWTNNIPWNSGDTDRWTAWNWWTAWQAWQTWKIVLYWN